METYKKLATLIAQFNLESIDEVRKETLDSLVDFIQDKVDERKNVKLNFICTHNSRRSHLAQIWAQTMAYYYNVPNVICYSGGTEATAVHPAVIEALKNTGFSVCTMTSSENPKYAIKFTEDQASIIGFSKRWDDASNPKDSFCAVMTCSEADGDCPVVSGAEKRISLFYNDPKVFDNLSNKIEQYSLTSMKIAIEMGYVFSKIKTINLV